MIPGASTVVAVQAMYEGSLSSPEALGLSLDKAAPLLIVATGTCIAARAGLFNIGQEGQLLIGAVAGALIAIYVPGPGPVGAGAVDGRCGRRRRAVGRHRRGAVLPAQRPVVISTLLLVYIAAQVVFYAVTQSWLLQEHGPMGAVAAPQSDLIREDAWLPRIGEYPGLNFSSTVIIALVLVAAVNVMLKRSTWGFRLKMLGMNRLAARRAGVSAVGVRRHRTDAVRRLRRGGRGALLTGGNHRLQPGISENVGWDGLLVALVARENPVLAIPVAFFFGVLRAGGGFLAATGVPRYIVDVVTAVLVLAAVFPPAFRMYQREMRSRRNARALAATGAAA